MEYPKYYEATVKLVNDDGKTKKTTSEKYLVSGITVSDIEVIVTKSFDGYTGEFKITEIKESKIVDVLKA